MEPKLQQAIVATRAGRTDVAQTLLTQLIREKPDDANAWFLLGHIVDTPERQALYLQKTIELDPNHSIARQRLMEIEDGPVLAPVIPQQPANGQSSDEASEEETVFNHSLAETTTIEELTSDPQEHDTPQLAPQTDENPVWVDSAGRPVREIRQSPEQAAVDPIPQNSPMVEPDSKHTTGEIWLVRILVIMVILAAIVLGILVLLIFI